MNKKQWIAYVVSALFSVLLFLIGRDAITRFVEGVPAQKVGISDLQANLKEIKIHDGDRWIDGPTSFDKNSLVVLRGYIHSSWNASETIHYYKKYVAGLGWSEAKIGVSVGEKVVKFCRSGVSLIIESRDEDCGDYYLRIAWTTHEMSDLYCSKSKVGSVDRDEKIYPR